MGDTHPIGALPPFGQVGSLLYLPREGPDDGIGTLETGRKLIHAPEFRVIRPFEVVNPAPKSSDVKDIDDVSYDERRVQERWLNNTLPEAYLGNTALPDLLGVGKDRPRGPRSDGRPPFKVHAVAGEISDCRNPWRVTGAASLTMATGEGGQILRILRLCESSWFWDENRDVSLGVWDLKPGDREEEAYWCRDAAPITRIKYFTHLALGAPLRWLVVQKGSSTTILSPVYHSVPVSYSNAALEERSASRVDPNEILSLTLAHTAGRSHVDVDFNSPRSGAPLQVALIDDHGGWSVWNVNGNLSPAAHGSPKLSLYKRGTFWEHIPDEHRGGFGILWYHPPPQSGSSDYAEESPEGGNGGAESDAALPSSASALTERSHTLMVWNHSTIQVLDTDVGSVSSYIPITERSEYKETILQIQQNPADPSQAFVLTTYSLLCLDICPSDEYPRDEGPRILHAFLHDHPGNTTLQLSASSSTLTDKPACVLVFPNDGPRANMFWFYGATGGASAGQFCHQLQYFRRDNRPELDSLHTLCVLPMRLASQQEEPSSGPGSMFRRLGVDFQQVISIGRRQSMGYWVCATAKRGMSKIAAPEPWDGSGLGPGRNPQAKSQIMRRLAYTRYMAEKFVVPDSLEDVDAFVQPLRGNGVHHEPAWLEFEPLPSVKREVIVKRRFYPHVVMKAYRASLLEGPALRSGSLEVVRQMLEAGLKPDNNHRISLLECVDIDGSQHINGDRDGNYPMDADDDGDWAWQLDEAVKAGLGVISLTEVHPNPPWHTSEFGEKLVAMKDWLAETWPIPCGDSQPEAAAQRRAVLEETALLAVLAYHTIEAKDPSLPSQDTPGLFSSQASTLAFSSQTTMDFQSQQPLSSQQAPSSQPSSSQPTASQQQARREADQEAGHAAIARLSVLATNLGRDASLSTAAQHPVLARWDEATSEDYMTFIERPAAALQERLQRRREKNVERRRAKEDAFNRLTGRAEVVASSPGEGGSGWLGAGAVGGLRGAGAVGQLSQGTSIPLRVRGGGELMSSQGTIPGMSQGITMSQPVGGVFGQRMGKKKKKKKGGIR